MKLKKSAAVALAATALVTAVGTRVDATNGNPINKGSQAAHTLAVIGDTPYVTAADTTKLTEFPKFVEQINSDPKVDLVVHVGDIKSGSTLCTDAWNTQVLSLFETFKDPLVYTPGDNEWTDCHRANNGHYLPTERLAAVRSLFFPVAGQTIGGRSKRVLSQADTGYRENVMWMEAKTVFATVNLPGSNNDAVAWSAVGAGWTGVSDPSVYPTQVQERTARTAAGLNWIDNAFTTATANGAKALVLTIQADMWDPTAVLSEYAPFVQKIGALSQTFNGPVLILEGDSHGFRVDHPFTVGDPLHNVFASTPVAPNVTRIVVEGSNAGRTEYVRLTVDPRTASVFAWERVPLAS